MTDDIDNDSLSDSYSLTYSQLNKLAQAFYDMGACDIAYSQHQPHPDGDAAYLITDLNIDQLTIDFEVEDLAEVKTFLDSHNLILMWDTRFGLEGFWPKPGEETDQNWSDICTYITREWGDYTDDDDNEETDND